MRICTDGSRGRRSLRAVCLATCRCRGGLFVLAGFTARRLSVLLVALLMVLPGVVPAAAADEPDGDEILQRMELVLFPENYRSRMEMVTTEPSGRERAMELSVQYQRGVGAYMEIEAPARSRGTRFLQRDDTLWMFIPRSGSRSPIRLAGRDSFQGSVFSNRDIGESMYTEDYHARLIGRTEMTHDELGQVEVYEVELTPRHDEAAYGRVVAQVMVEDFIPLQMSYYVRAGMNTKELFLSDMQQLAGRQRPSRMEMVSYEEEGKVTVVRLLEMQQDDQLPDRILPVNI